ncbi:Rhodocoxin reductase [Hyphomicrobiales bacterium]|nr:Rhodocoxin reductase [Hyphomicrobiales bacterium]CAH1690522.1 Rhodocoxin reductase [Hyphomicrobiales bacterium]
MSAGVTRTGVVIVGAGHGGSQAAVSLRQDGYSRPITLIGDEPGYPYHRPPLSKAFMKASDDKLQPLRGEAIYAANDIDYRPGTTVRAIDLAGRRCLLDKGDLPFRELILATGARPRSLAIEGCDREGIFTLRTAADARHIKEHMAASHHAVIVGGGFIGLEIAATMAALGKRVTVLELGERLLARAISPAVSNHVLARLAAGGVDVRFGAQVATFEGGTSVQAVTTRSGDSFPADIVMIGIGAAPDVALAEQAGIHVDGGVVVDEYLRTSADQVFAIGDCARFPHWQTGGYVRLESVQNATDQARHVAQVILGQTKPYAAVPWFWSDIADMKLQMVGLPIGADRQLVAGEPENNAFSVYHFRGDDLVAIDTVNRPAEHMLGRKMIAADYRPTEHDIMSGRLSDAFRQWSAASAGSAAIRST